MNRHEQFATPEQVQRHIERVLPDEVCRRMCLSIFADSIDRLHAQGPDRWGVYCEGDLVRLLGGRLIVLAIVPNEVWLALDQKAIDVSVPMPNQLNAVQGKSIRYDTGRWAHYKRPPTTNIFYSPTTDNMQAWQSFIKSLHFALLDRVARYAFRDDSQSNHQPSVSAYLQRVLPRWVPEPAYSSSGKSVDNATAFAAQLRDEEGDSDNTDSHVGYSPQAGDRREVVERQIRERRGQPQFRDALCKRYGNRCLVTGSEVLAVLEAAHIKPYRGEDDNHPENGLLLRADIHTLFDLDLLGIEPEQLRVELHPDLAKDREYGSLTGRTLGCARDQRPSREALQLRYAQFQQRGCQLA